MLDVPHTMHIHVTYLKDGTYVGVSFYKIYVPNGDVNNYNGNATVPVKSHKGHDHLYNLKCYWTLHYVTKHGFRWEAAVRLV